MDLKSLPLFAALSPEISTRLEARMRRHDFPPHAVIVREGSADDSAFFVLSGRVAVRKKDLDSGIDFLLAELGEGQMFGEMALLTRQPRNATVVALEETACAVLDHPDFVELVAEHPNLALEMMRVLAERLEKADRHIGIDFVNLSRMKIDPRVLALLPQSLIAEHHVIPIAFMNNRLTLAMTNPNNVVAFDDVRRLIKGVMIEPSAISEDDFRRFMSTAYAQLMVKPEVTAPSARPAQPAPASGVASSARRPDAASEAKSSPSTMATIDLLQSDLIRELQLQADKQADQEDTTGQTKQDLMNASEDAPIIRVANSILGLAIKQGASDIHIEPMEADVTVRFRIDGVLQVLQKLPKRVQLGLISRLKILAKLDIAEKRLPQDGRISVTMDNKPIDFRVSTVPGKWGEKVCMRILDKSNTLVGLDKLISEPSALALVREMIEQPYGIIYVTGPTGSGKTTTLYAALAEINEPGVNISTVEDPIEYDLAGVTQIQVNSDIGLTFPGVLRAFLRQDPDILLVGETRDKETAHTAVEAALTGHLVFTTLHTNSAAAAFTRLNEMGIQPFLVSSSTIGLIAQRLARRLCQECKQPYAADANATRFFGLPDGATLYRGAGCSACANKGVRGRVGIYEVMKMNPSLRSMVGSGVRAEELHSAALASGMVDLKAYSARLLTAGLTTVEEVTSVVNVEV